jgi:hypothetical protein
MRIADGAGGFDAVLDLGRQRLACLVRRTKIGVAVTPMAIMALLRLGPGRLRRDGQDQEHGQHGVDDARQHRVDQPPA